MLKVAMDQGTSKQLFVHLLSNISKARGAKVKLQKLPKFLEFIYLLTDTSDVRGKKEEQQQLLQFLKCVKDVYPRLPVEGSLSLEI